MLHSTTRKNIVINGHHCVIKAKKGTCILGVFKVVHIFMAPKDSGWYLANRVQFSENIKSKNFIFKDKIAIKNLKK